MFVRRKFWVPVTALAVGLSFLYMSSASADVSVCTANVSPQSVYRDMSTTLTFDFDTQADVAVWVEIIAPSTDFRITSAGNSDWSVLSSNDQQVILERIGGGNTIPVDIVAGSVDVPAADWSVNVSDDPGGANAAACTGSLSVEISGDGIDSTAPIISNVALSNVTATSATITWNTDEPASSQVDYGPDGGYGQTKYSTTHKTNHSVTLTGLTPSSGYHYRVWSADPANNTTYSPDNTFLTPAPSQTPTSQPVTQVPIKSTPTETVPPTILLTTQFNKPYTSAPKITGEASDNEALAGVEYSTDGGLNWLPSDPISGLPAKNATFSFTPPNLDDGNYAVLARAIDTSGNITTTDALTLVIDRLPPLVGGNVISLGPQILEPDQNSTTKAMAGVDQKITFSAVGGPTTITLTAKQTDSKSKTKQFMLTKSADTGLWSGILAFEEAGQYTLTADSVDGANNKTSRVVSSMQVSAPASVTGQQGNKGITAEVTAYYFEPESKEWMVWDAAAYSQANPQTTDRQGRFTLLVPRGTYYLKISASGYRTVTTKIFKTSQPTPISASLHMKKKRFIDFGSDLASIDTSTAKITDDTIKHALIGKPLPNVKLNVTDGRTVNPVDWLGKPTVLTLTSTWTPATAAQVPALTSLQDNKDINVVPIALQERVAKAKAYASLSGHTLTWAADPDSTLGMELQVQSLPTHYFLDRKGILQKVLTGTLSEQQLRDVLSNL